MAMVGQRLTPATQLHASQPPVTSDVIEYRCMWTPDLLKKAKKWHDGRLKYHAFNKRVMVYGDGGNFVGDLHYRSSEPFGEGIELKLDRPILVEVGDALEQSKTDLTPLLRRHIQDVSVLDGTYESTSRHVPNRSSAPNTQLQPKSIRELLGPSRGHFERVRLAVRSPFEVRQLADSESNGEPAAKKRRTDVGKENRGVAKSSVDHTNIVQHETLKQYSIEDPVTLSKPDVFDLSSDEDASTLTRPTAERPKIRESVKSPSLESRRNPKKLKQKSKPVPVDISASMSTTPSAQDLPRPQSCQRTNTDAVTKKASRKNNMQNSEVSVQSHPGVQLIASRTSHAAQSLLREPRCNLVFTNDSRRPKLMHRRMQSLKPTTQTPQSTSSRATLPAVVTQVSMTHDVSGTACNNLLESTPANSGSQKSTTSESEVPETRTRVGLQAGLQNGSQSLSSLQEDGSAKDRTDVPAQAEPDSHRADIALNCGSSASKKDRLDTELTGSRLNSSQKLAEESRTIASAESETYSSPPILRDTSYLSDMPKSVPEELVQCSQIEENRPLLNLKHSQRSQSNELPSINSTTEPQLATPDVKSTNNRSASGVNESASVPIPDTTAAAMSAQIESGRSRNKRLFGRVLSEAASISRNLDRQLDGGVAPLLRTSTSDSQILRESIDEFTQIQQPFIRQIDAEIPEKPTYERDVRKESTGPWTDEEAYMLFDWWPPNREKPDYGPTSLPDSSPEPPGLEGVEARGGIYMNKAARNNKLYQQKYGTWGSAKFVSQK